MIVGPWESIGFVNVNGKVNVKNSTPLKKWPGTNALYSLVAS